MVKRAFAAVAVVCVCSAVTEARVTRIEILKVERVDPPSSGAPEAIPPYERLSGKFYGELDPADPKNAADHRHPARGAQRARQGRVRRHILADETGRRVEGRAV